MRIAVEMDCSLRSYCTFKQTTYRFKSDGVYCYVDLFMKPQLTCHFLPQNELVMCFTDYLYKFVIWKFYLFSDPLKTLT